MPIPRIKIKWLTPHLLKTISHINQASNRLVTKLISLDPSGTLPILCVPKTSWASLKYDYK